MGYEERPQSSSAGAVIVVVVIVLAVGLAALVALGLGAIFLARTSVRQTQVEVIRQQEQAMVAHEQAVRQMQGAQERAKPPISEVGELVVQALPPASSTRELTIAIAEDGSFTVDGQPMTAERLQEFLTEIGQAGDAKSTATIEVDRRCVFEHVAAVLAVCEARGVQILRVRVQPDEPNP